MPQVEVGKNLYLFSPATVATACIISSHGDYLPGLRGNDFVVPDLVTLNFYVPHGDILLDPGVSQYAAMVRGEYRPSESIAWGNGRTCANYHLSKFQEAHEGKVLPTLGPRGETYSDLEKNVTDHEARTDQINNNVLLAKKSIVNSIFQGRPVSDDQRKTLKKREEQAENDQPYHVLTVRNKCNFDIVRLGDAIHEVRKLRPEIMTFHCCFCRMDFAHITSSGLSAEKVR